MYIYGIKLKEKGRRISMCRTGLPLRGGEGEAGAGRTARLGMHYF